MKHFAEIQDTVYRAKRVETAIKKIREKILKEHSRLPKAAVQEFVDGLEFNFVTEKPSEVFDQNIAKSWGLVFTDEGVVEGAGVTVLLQKAVTKPGIITAVRVLEPPKDSRDVFDEAHENRKPDYQAIRDTVEQIQNEKGALAWNTAKRLANLKEGELVKCDACGSSINWSAFAEANHRLQNVLDLAESDGPRTYQCHMAYMLACPICKGHFCFDSSETEAFMKLNERLKDAQQQKSNLDSELRAELDRLCAEYGEHTGWAYAYMIPYDLGA